MPIPSSSNRSYYPLATILTTLWQPFLTSSKATIPATLWQSYQYHPLATVPTILRQPFLYRFLATIPTTRPEAISISSFKKPFMPTLAPLLPSSRNHSYHPLATIPTILLQPFLPSSSILYHLLATIPTSIAISTVYHPIATIIWTLATNPTVLSDVNHSYHPSSSHFYIIL